ncbi:unnamed protein product [Pleuronectes platessa]|uniref:Uncharacterized protein n=1 Tax=Pleuronectes platessa TaxID=8262 RepID=A0A9N7VM52_PLEPL|nr:unnamed protein product [Pleuronectes platessa]
MATRDGGAELCLPQHPGYILFFMAQPPTLLLHRAAIEDHSPQICVNHIHAQPPIGDVLTLAWGQMSNRHQAAKWATRSRLARRCFSHTISCESVGPGEQPPERRSLCAASYSLVTEYDRQRCYIRAH